MNWDPNDIPRNPISGNYCETLRINQSIRRFYLQRDGGRYRKEPLLGKLPVKTQNPEKPINPPAKKPIKPPAKKEIRVSEKQYADFLTAIRYFAEQHRRAGLEDYSEGV